MSNPKKKRKIRVDELLVERGLAPDLAKARAYVMAGQVLAGDRRVDKAGERLERTTALRLRGVDPHVSRAGRKLASAVEDFGVAERFQDASVLDVGASTGGFTQTALELGARRVVACDVGQNQLAWELRSDSRVVCIERTDVRDLRAEQVGPVDIVVADVSFISLARLVPELVRLGGQGALYLLLVKPQFELPRELVPDGGVVSDPALRARAVDEVVQALRADGLHGIRQADSRVAGRTGNVEIFVLAKS